MGLGEVGDRHPDLGARVVERGDHLGRRAAERERDDRDPLAVKDGQLRPPLVVVIGGVADLDPVAVGLDLEAIEVGGQPGAVDRGGAGDEHVDAERPVGELAELSDLGPNRGRRLVAAGEEPEAPGAATAAVSSGVEGPPARGA